MSRAKKHLVVWVIDTKEIGLPTYMRMIVCHCKNQPILWNVTYFCCTVSMMRCWRNVVADLCSVWFRKVHQLKHQHGEFLLVCPKFAPFAQSFLWSPTLLSLPSLPRKAIPGKMRKIKNVKSWCSSRQRMNSRLSQCEIRICFPGWFCCIYRSLLFLLPALIDYWGDSVRFRSCHHQNFIGSCCCTPFPSTYLFPPKREPIELTWVSGEATNARVLDLRYDQMHSDRCRIWCHDCQVIFEKGYNMGIPPAISGCTRFANYNQPVKWMIIESRTSTPSPEKQKAHVSCDAGYLWSLMGNLCQLIVWME